MTFTISQYLEALISPEGRWRTLRRIYPVTDESGDPLFTLPSNGAVDFEVMVDTYRAMLRCGLRSSGTLCVAGWELLEREVVLFTDDGRVVEVDVSIRRLPEAFRGGCAVVETSTGLGLVDSSGRTVLAPRFEELVWDESGGVAAVMEQGRWSLVDSRGDTLTRQTYDWLGEISEGLMVAVRDGLCGFIDTAGREVIPCIYDEAFSFVDGWALVRQGSETFHIDCNPPPPPTRKFEAVKSPENGRE